jgi:hypothetical protein
MITSLGIVYLDGRSSEDPDNDQITAYSWQQIGGPAVILSGADTLTPTFTAPRLSSHTTLKFSYSVTDKSTDLYTLRPDPIKLNILACEL